jgi:hypothetical protein
MGASVAQVHWGRVGTFERFCTTQQRCWWVRSHLGIRHRGMRAYERRIQSVGQLRAPLVDPLQRMSGCTALRWQWRVNEPFEEM